MSILHIGSDVGSDNSNSSFFQTPEMKDQKMTIRWFIRIMIFLENPDLKMIQI